MMLPRKCVPALLLATVVAADAAGQSAPEQDSVRTFLDAAARASEQYADRAVAIRQGYRKVGPDFPGMGEHWVQPGRLVSGRFVAEAPPILTYATIDGQPVLTGVAYALPLAPGESPPAFPRGDHWHDHAASVDEESLLIAPLAAARAHAHGNTVHAPRLAMLHAWLWSPNPDGVFAQDNWALPYLRLGLDPPPHIDRDAARALSFLNGGDDYYRALFRAAVPLDAAALQQLDRITVELREELSAWRAARPPHDVVSDDGTSTLRAAWHRFWHRALAAVPPAARTRLSDFAPRTASDPHH
jgi:hypothetical protein